MEVGNTRLVPRRNRLHRRDVKNHVKLTFAKGAAVKDPSRLFNSSLEGNIRRAIDIHEGEKINEASLKKLIRAAVALNLHLSKSKLKTRRASTKRAR